MTELKDLIYIEKILTDEQCDELVAERERRDSESKTEVCMNALTDEPTEATFKQVQLIPETKNFKTVHDSSEKIIQNWIHHLNDSRKFSTMSLKHQLRYSHIYRLMKYDVGGWIHPHIDWSHLIMGSLTIALNDPSEYEGGDFSFFNGEYRLKLKKGEAMVFPANHFFVHEVKEITSGVRYSVNSFLTSLPYEEVLLFNEEFNKRKGFEEHKTNPFFYPSSDELKLGEGY